MASHPRTPHPNHLLPLTCPAGSPRPFPVRKTALVILLCSSLVAACGGGGGGASPAPAPGPKPPAPAPGQPSQPGQPGQPGQPVPPSPPAAPAQGPLPPSITPSVKGEANGLPAAGQPAAVLRPQASSPIAYEQSSAARVWVVNPDQDSVSVLDSRTQALIQEIPVGTAPRTLAIDNAGFVWVSNRGSGTVSIIDPARLAVSATIELSPAAQPYGVVNAPDGSGIWVSLIGTQEIMRFDPVTRALRQRIHVGPEVRHLAISPDSQRLLASRFISPPLPDENTASPRITGPGVRGGEVMVIKLQPALASPLKTVSLAVSQVEDTVISGGGLPNYLGAAAISPDGKTAWIPSKQDNLLRGRLRNRRHLDFQNTIRAVVSKISLEGEQPAELPEQRFDLDNTSLASAITYTPDGKFMVVALETSREIAIMRASTGREVLRKVMGGGFAPQGVAVSPDGRQLAVSNFMSRDVSFFDLAPLLETDDPYSVQGHKAVHTLNTPERLPAAVLRGKQLFYDAFDVRLARDRYMSCAVCHNDGYGDGRVWDMTGFGEGLRKTISLRGHGGKKKLLHWSGNFDELQDFEQQIRALSGGAGLMSEADFQVGPSGRALGAPKKGRSDDLDALAAYFESLQTYAPSPFRQPDRSLGTAAKAGEALFTSLDCASCHSTPDLGGDGTVRSDIGTLKPASGKVAGQPLTGIVAPGLRDAWYNAPYLHDGSAPTLEAAIKAHNNLTLSDAELERLAAFVRETGNGS